MSGRLYRWTVSLADSPHATWTLGAIAFCESSFFPLPPDLVLVPMVVARPDRALGYAAVCTVASVAGGILGYGIGAYLYSTLGAWLISVYGYGDRMAQLQDFYRHWGWAFILVKGLTPIPYKLVTIVSGVLGYSFPLFLVLSIITRGARFFILAGLLSHFGDSIRGSLERHFAIFLIVMALIIVVGFVIAMKVV
jgi:membrane protein YqaA with SNARE-associated domain